MRLRVIMVTLLGAATVAGVAASVFHANASSDDAWAAFRADVEAACLKAAEPLFQSAAAVVDPFGSKSYGLALIKGKAKGADTEIAAICVYDKKTKAAEIGGELPAD
jgi:hypothetical protein